eukprot:319268-Pyramimonas_sp.AAC.1
MQAVYNGSGIRIDGNYKLAKKISAQMGQRKQMPFSCVLGICGADGSPLQPVTPVRGETWADIRKASRAWAAGNESPPPLLPGRTWRPPTAIH